LDPSDPAHAGQAAYTPTTLRAYDTVVVRLSNSFVWHCPARRILGHYNRQVAASHLDVGPGTGYYLERCRFPTDTPRLALLDPNRSVLEYAGHRLRRYRPSLHAGDALKPVDLDPASFGSVGLSYVLHCLPGDIHAKAAVFDHVSPLVSPGGVVFGSTILYGGVRHGRLARTLLGIYNRKGIFSNTGDDLDGLDRELANRFDRYELTVVGGVALFSARIDPGV
jgi:SAM-dependent methyltransferase